MDKVGAASNKEVSVKMKWIKKLIFAKYHVMHPKNEVLAYKSMPVQALYAWFNLMLDILHNWSLCQCQVSNILVSFS